MTSVVELAGADAPGGAASSNPDLRWYIVHAYSGMEKAVERNILERIARSGMQDKFGRILVPTEEVVEMKNGQTTSLTSRHASRAKLTKRLPGSEIKNVPAAASSATINTAH